jgi:hypothetical protein
MRLFDWRPDMEPIDRDPSLQGVQERIINRELRKPGYKSKIRAFCCHCIYDPYQEGTWLKQVENCTSWHCPLYSVRPTPKGKAED